MPSEKVFWYIYIPSLAFLFQICEDVLYSHCAKCAAEMRFGAAVVCVYMMNSQ